MRFTTDDQSTTGMCTQADTGSKNTNSPPRESARTIPYPQTGAAKLSFTARIKRPPFYRGGSVSKKDGLAALRSSLLQEQRIRTGVIQAILSWGVCEQEE